MRLILFFIINLVVLGLLINLYFILQAILWNMDTLRTEGTPEEHTSIITDVRFRPNSSQLATSSLDRTVRLWNAEDV